MAQKISQVTGVGLVTLAVANLNSDVVSLTETPMMSPRMQSHQSFRNKNSFTRPSELMYELIKSPYVSVFAKVLNQSHKQITQHTIH
ncbi:hypothetical protein [Enterobacter hormaechei]